MKRVTLTLTLLLLAGIARAETGTWAIDSAHSSARFSVRHMMISDVAGRFAKVGGTIVGDPKKPAGAMVDVTIDATTLDTDVDNRDKHLKSADFFDVEKFPTITFKSKKIMAPRRKSGKIKITGDLTMHGVTREVVLDASMTPEIKDTGGNPRIGVKAATRIDRKDFGLTWSRTLEGGGVVVGNQVMIDIDLELTKKKPDAPAAGR